MNDLIDFLTENCCQGASCTTAAACKPARGKRAKVAV
jgi:ArsR family transcriptional regulator